jgi:hypothetical protein
VVTAARRDPAGAERAADVDIAAKIQVQTAETPDPDWTPVGRLKHDGVAAGSSVAASLRR